MKKNLKKLKLNKLAVANLKGGTLRTQMTRDYICPTEDARCERASFSC